MFNDKDIERLRSLTDGKDYGIFPPPMDAQVAMNELWRYFFGDEYVSTCSISNTQVNTIIVEEIERLCHRKRFRKRKWRIR